MGTQFEQQFAALVTSDSPPPSIFVHSPLSSPLCVSTVLSILRRHSEREDKKKTIEELLPKVAHVDLEQVHTTKQLFDHTLNQFVDWRHEWRDGEMAVQNWHSLIGFDGLRVVESPPSSSTAPKVGHDARQRKRQRMMRDEQDFSRDDDDQQEDREVDDDDENEVRWKLEWNVATAKPPIVASSTKLAPVRNTVEAFHQSLTTIFDLSSATAVAAKESDDDQGDFEPGISLSMEKRSASRRRHKRRYIVVEHGELLGDLAVGSSAASSSSGAAKETGIGMTFTSTLHRLAQLSQLPITVVVLSRFPYRKSRENLVGLASPILLEYSEPTLENSLPLLYARFASSSSYTGPPRPPSSRLSAQDVATLFKTLLQLVAMTMQSAIGNDVDELNWTVCTLWPRCVELVERSNPPIPPDRLDRLKIALQPELNSALSRIGQPRPSLSSLLITRRPCLTDSGPGSGRRDDDDEVRHGFSGVIRDAPKGPTYLDPVVDDDDSSRIVDTIDHSPHHHRVRLSPFVASSNSTTGLHGGAASPLSQRSTPTINSSLSSSSLSKSLPTVSRFVLVAAFLAAHNPPKSDVRMFVKVDDLDGASSARRGKKSKRGAQKVQPGVSPKKKRGNVAAFMSGGKPFAYERLMAIFESIVDEQREFAIGTISVHQSVQTLISLRLLLKASGEKSDKGALDGVRLKCPLSRDEVDRLAKGVGWSEWKERLVDIDD
ncbi:hypothetical protein JCM3766R1_001828 [Sporobolomyces carnicolor]